MSFKGNIKKNLSRPFNAAKAFDKKLDETKVGSALNKGLGAYDSAFNKTVGRVISPRNHAASVAVDVALGGVLVATAATAGGILWPVVGGAGAAAATYCLARDANYWRKDRKAKKNPPSAGPA